MRDWFMRTCHREGEDQYWVVVVDNYPRWKWAGNGAWELLCLVTRGWVGGHGLPEIFWNIPVGKAKWDYEYNILDNSIANLLLSLEGWILDHTDIYEYEVGEISISRDDAFALAPEFVLQWEELGENDDS